jgi:hypothetical protein
VAHRWGSSRRTAPPGTHSGALLTENVVLGSVPGDPDRRPDLDGRGPGRGRPSSQRVQRGGAGSGRAGGGAQRRQSAAGRDRARAGPPARGRGGGEPTRGLDLRATERSICGSAPPPRRRGGALSLSDLDEVLWSRAYSSSPW